MGSAQGRFFSPVGTPLEMKALPPGGSDIRRVFEILKPLETEVGYTAPAFGKAGWGIQFRTPRSAAELLKRGFIREIEQ